MRWVHWLRFGKDGTDGEGTCSYENTSAIERTPASMAEPISKPRLNISNAKQDHHSSRLNTC